MDISRDSKQDRFRTLKKAGRPPRVSTASSKVGQALSALEDGDEAAAGAVLEGVIDTATGLSHEAEEDLRELTKRPGTGAAVRALAWDALSLSDETNRRQTEALEAARSALEISPSAHRHGRVALLTLRLVGPGEAEALIDEGLQRWPDDADLLSVRAVAALDVGDNDRADAASATALAQAPQHPLALAARARLLITIDRPEEALAVARDMVAADPALGRGLVAVALFDAQRLEEDPGVVDAVLANLPTDWWVLNQFAGALRALGRLDDAITTLDRAVELGPHSLNVLGNRGYVHALRGDMDAADRDLELSAAAIGDPMLLWVRGEVARLRDDLSTAIEVLSGISPDEVPEVDISLGSALSDAGDVDGATVAFERALARNPQSLNALYGLGQIVMAEGDLDRATQMFELARDTAPDQPVAHALIAEAKRRAGNEQEALSEFDRALELNPTYAYALASKGQTLLALGEEAAGIDQLEQAALAEPMTGWVLDELVHVVETTQPEPDKHLRKVQRAIRDAERDTVPLCTRRARMAMRQSRWVDAERLFGWVRRRRPDDGGLAGEYAEALSAVGRKAEALEVLGELPELDPGQRWQRIDLLWALDRLDEVRQELESLYEAGDSPAIVAAGLGEVHRAEGNREQARRLLTEAHEQEPEHAYTLASLGALERDEDNLAEARRYLGLALEYQPAYAFALGVLVSIEIQEGNAQAARDLLATINAEHDLDLVDVKAGALSRLGDHTAAWQVLDEYALEYGDDPRLLRTRGRIEVLLGQVPRAARTFRAAASLPDTAPNLLDTVDALLRVDAVRPALDVIEEAHEQDNDYWPTALALVWFHAGGWTEAASLALAGAAARPTSSQVGLVAGFALRMDGRAEEALPYESSAIYRVPTEYTWRGSHAETLWQAGDLAGARSMHEDLLQRLDRLPYLDPDDLSRKAWTLFRLDRNDEATDAMLRALSATDQTAQTLVNLLLITLAGGDVTQAALLRVRAGRELKTLSAVHKRGILARFEFHMRSLQGRIAASCEETAQGVLSDWGRELTALDRERLTLAAATGWAAHLMPAGATVPEQRLHERQDVHITQ